MRSIHMFVCVCVHASCSLKCLAVRVCVCVFRGWLALTFTNIRSVYFSFEIKIFEWFSIIWYVDKYTHVVDDVVVYILLGRMIFPLLANLYHSFLCCCCCWVSDSQKCHYIHTNTNTNTNYNVCSHYLASMQPRSFFTVNFSCFFLSRNLILLCNFFFLFFGSCCLSIQYYVGNDSYCNVKS